MFYNEKTSIKQRQAILLLLKHINECACFKGQALGDIYSSFENTQLEKCSFLMYLKNKKEINPLYSAVNNCRSLHIGKANKQSLLNFALLLGKCTNNDNLITLCGNYIKNCEQSFEAHNKKSNDKAILYLKLCPLVGFFVLLIVL